MFETERLKGVELIRFPRLLSSAAAPGLRQQLATLVKSGRNRLLLDLSDVQTADASGLSVILTAHEEVRRSGGDLALLRPSNKLRSLIQLTRIHHLMGIFEDLPSALLSVRKSARRDLGIAEARQ